MRYFELFEDFASQPNDWVHYSRTDFLSINPKPFHQDAAGIYFFPKNFSPIGYWQKYPYKFTVTIKPSTHILDLAHITEEELYAMIDAAGIRDKFESHIEKYPPVNMNKKMDQAWEALVRYYSFENGEGKRLGKFNKMLRSLGYDAIFDDGKIVHCAEEQLIVLDPRCINVVKLEKRSGSGYKEMKKVMADLVEVCKPYGKIEITEPKKVNPRYGSGNKVLQATVEVKRSEDNFISFTLTAEGDAGEPPSQIHVGAGYSRPYLNASHSSRYNIMAGKYDDYFGSGFADIKLALEKTFPQNDA